MKAIILAAGIGTRIGDKAQFFNKSLLKIGNQAAISHIIDYFPADCEFIIVTGYLYSIVEQYIAIAHPNINVRFIRQENNIKGPGDALLLCEEHLNEPFFIWCCDTLVDNPSLDESSNWIGYARTNGSLEEYSCIAFSPNDRIITDFHEKGEFYTQNAFIGCAFVKDYFSFVHNLKHNPLFINEQYHISAGFRGLLNDKKVIKAKEFTWHDIGSLTKLQETKQHFKSKIENLDKVDEEIYFLKDRAIKYFYNSETIKNRHTKSKVLKGFVPTVIDCSDNFYSYKYIEGVDLFDKSVDIASVLSHLLETLWKSELWKEKTLDPDEYMRFQNACVNFYYKKTKGRLEQFYKKLNVTDSVNIINGENVPKLKDMLSVLSWQKILSGKPCLMHGDMALSNIIVQSKEGKLDFTLIDFRHDFGGIVEYGDFYCDLAKIYATLLFPFDIIKEKRFHIDIAERVVSYEIEKMEFDRYESAKFSFFAWLASKNIDIKKIKQLTSIILLNMSPLHEAPLDSLLYYLGKYEMFKSLKE